MRQTTKQVSAIVVTYFTGPTLKRSINTLKSQTDIHQIIIIDNGNPAGDKLWLEQISKRDKRICILKPDTNLGFGRAANLGAMKAFGDILLFINPDAIIESGVLKKLMDAIPDNISPWLVGGQITNPDGIEQRGCRRGELNLTTLLNDAIGLSRLSNTFPIFKGIDRSREPAPQTPISIPTISGAFFLMPKSDFLQLEGGFAEAYFLHFEDIDLCKRVRNSGGQVIYTPHAKALHYKSTSKVGTWFIAQHKTRGLIRFINDHSRSPIDRIMIHALAPILILVFWLRESQR